MRFVRTFKETGKKDAGQAGGKGASLGEMAQAGIPVPPGFVITADAFRAFLEHAPDSEMEKVANVRIAVEAELGKVQYDDVNSVDRASHIIRDIIHSVHVPDDIIKEIQRAFSRLRAARVAVRSSATAEDSESASWAGELETYLNTTSKTLLENVVKCWSSLYTARALFYRHEKGMREDEIAVAVVVQKMVPADVSGICFTVHPVTQDRNQMIIEAGWGLGEAIVSGSITPDSYIIEKSPFRIADIHISEQERYIAPQSSGVAWKPVPRTRRSHQKLTRAQIAKLARTCIAIEKHYKKPQDIEWAFSRGRLYILQSRPITTLS